MESVATIAEGLAKNPSAWIAALALAAVVYLFRELRASDKASLERAMADAAAHRLTLEKVLPVAEKCADAVESLEKITQTLVKG